MRKEDSVVMILVYVDELVITRNDSYLIQETRTMLHNGFKIKDLGKLKFFHEIEFSRSKKGILMNQRRYALELISETELVEIRLLIMMIKVKKTFARHTSIPKV